MKQQELRVYHFEHTRTRRLSVLALSPEMAMERAENTLLDHWEEAGESMCHFGDEGLYDKKWVPVGESTYSDYPERVA